MENLDPNSIRIAVIEDALAAAIAGLQIQPQVAAHLRFVWNQLVSQGRELPPDSFRLLRLLESAEASPAAPPPTQP